MDRFEHGRETAFRINIRGRRYAQTTRQRASQIGKDIGVQIGGNDGIQGLGMQRHTVRHGIDQHFVPLHIREFLRHFSGNLIPHHHTMALGVGFGHHGQQFTWTRLCQSEGIAHNACHPNTGKDCHFGTDFFR
ncbi:Uncharacterised protein [Klebsiella pneumoniae]|nr:Uncharacterised protein [Klebsiella pneumoniae]